MFELRTIDGKNKRAFYEELNAQARALLHDEHDLVANSANICALLYYALSNVNWVGVYFLKGDELVVGPFQGKPACVRIAFGKGVCGTAAARRETILVPDVSQFPGHIYCDADSRSELVVPLVKDGKLLGVLDIDSPMLARFDEEDRLGLGKIVETLLQSL